MVDDSLGRPSPSLQQSSLHSIIRAFSLLPYSISGVHLLSTSGNISLFVEFEMAAELEPPFFPREKLIEKQKYFQSIHKHTYLKGRFDIITSVAIPLAFTAASMYMIGKGIYNMSHGIGKKE